MKMDIQLTAEAEAAMTRKAPTDKRLKQILLDNEEKTMPSPEEAR